MTKPTDYKALADTLAAMAGVVARHGEPADNGTSVFIDAASALRKAGEMDDRIEGLTADLFNAVETAHGRGATEWARLNYSKWIERIEANAAARSALKGTST